MAKHRLRSSVLGATTLFLTIVVLGDGSLNAAEATRSATSRPAASTAPTATAAAPATTQRRLGAHTSRILSNFAVLMKSNWPSLAAFVTTTILKAILWAAALFLAGVLAGLLSYFLLRRVGLFNAPWAWYRFVRWLWPVVFTLAAAGGFTYSGAWLGLARNVKSYIREHRMLDRIVGQLFFAIALDEGDYQATGQESAQKLQRVLANSDAVARLAMADWAISREKLLAATARSPFERWLVRLAVTNASEELAERLRGLDPRLVVVLFGMHPNIDEYMRQHPEAHPVVAALSIHFQPMREKACDMVDGVARPRAVLGIAGGLLAPMLLLALFRLVVRLAGRRAQRRC